MIYLDNGATTFPKPETVVRSVNVANKFYSANPGRGGHKASIKASEMVYNARETVADYFGLKNPENVIFTLNCTTALNLVIKGILKQGDHVVISSYEHNSVVRPIESMKSKGISYSIAQVIEGDNDKTLDNFRKVIKDNTKLLVCTHASNVFGVKLPVERICALCHQYGVLCCVDAAQTAGIVPINLYNSSIDYLCIAGHKGLYGPMGTGALLINCEHIPESLIQGGTGSGSLNTGQPDILPDKFESGTCNFSGIAGLKSGIEFIKNYPKNKIYNNEIQLIKYLYKALNRNSNIILYTKEPTIEYNVPLLSFNVQSLNSEAVSEFLDSKFNIAVRGGLHCAPLAHNHHNTTEHGTVRVVPSVFTTKNQIEKLIFALNKL